MRSVRNLNSFSFYHTSPHAQSCDVQTAARLVLRRARAALHAALADATARYIDNIHRTLYGAPKNTAGAVYPTWGLEQLKRLKQSLATRP